MLRLDKTRSMLAWRSTFLLPSIESLRLARAELERQSGSTTHPVRKQQIQAAIAEIDKRLALG